MTALSRCGLALHLDERDDVTAMPPSYTPEADDLRRLMRQRRCAGRPLTVGLVARLLGVARSTVAAWLLPVTSPSHRAMPRRYLRYLDALLIIVELRRQRRLPPAARPDR